MEDDVHEQRGQELMAEFAALQSDPEKQEEMRIVAEIMAGGRAR